MPLDATVLGVISLLIGQAIGDSSISENLRRLQDRTVGQQGLPAIVTANHHTPVLPQLGAPAVVPASKNRTQLRRRRATRTEVPHKCQRVPRHGCSICGPDRCVGNSHAMVTLPAALPGEAPPSAAITCGYLQHAGYMGRLSEDHCDVGTILSWIDVCECGDGLGTTAGAAPQTTAPPLAQSDPPPIDVVVVLSSPTNDDASSADGGVRSVWQPSSMRSPTPSSPQGLDSVESVDEYAVSEDDTYIDLYASPPELADVHGNNKNVEDPNAAAMKDVEPNHLSPVSAPTPMPWWI
jgi:hypothetical protein